MGKLCYAKQLVLIEQMHQQEGKRYAKLLNNLR
jgi:hypothetical protein